MWDRSPSFLKGWIVSHERNLKKLDGSLAERKLRDKKRKWSQQTKTGWRSLNSSFSQVVPTVPHAALGRGQGESGHFINHLKKEVPREEVKLWGLKHPSHLQVWVMFTVVNSQISTERCVFSFKIFRLISFQFNCLSLFDAIFAQIEVW